MSRTNCRIPLCALAWVTALLVAACGCGRREAKTLYRNADLGLSLEYPSAWETKPNSQGTVVTFVASQAESTGPDRAQAGLSVMSTTLTRENLKEAFRLVLNKAHDNVGASYDLLEQGDVKVGKLEGARFLYLSKQADAKQKKKLEYLFIQGDTLYHLLCECDPEQFDRFAPVFRQVCESIKVE